MKRRTLYLTLISFLVAALGTPAFAQESQAVSIPDSCTVGDIDLDGVSSTIADVALFSSYFRCGISVFTYIAPIQIGNTDFNCDGVVLSVADLVALLRVLSGDIEPCYCMAGSTAVLNGPVSQRASVIPYDLALVDQPGSGFGRDTVEVMLSGAMEMLGIQIALEYDTAGINLVTVERTDLLADWQAFSSIQKYVGSKAELRIFATHNMDAGVPPGLMPPADPTAMFRIIFDISPDANLTRDINFIWDDCGDNGIAVGDTTFGDCGAPDFLGVSLDVFDADGGVITGSAAPYGGAYDLCVAGLPDGGAPQRAVNYHNGRMEYVPSCCQGMRGDVDGDGDNAVISDLTCLVGYLFGDGCSATCAEEADFNGSGITDITDVTDFVAYLFNGGAPPASCQ